MIERIVWQCGEDSICFDTHPWSLWLFDPADFSHTVSGRFTNIQPAALDGQVTTSAYLDGAYTRLDVLLNAPAVANRKVSVDTVLQRERSKLYRLFCPSRPGRLTVEQNGRQYTIDGYPAAIPVAGQRTSCTALFTLEINHDSPAFAVLPEHRRDIFSKRSSAYLVNYFPMRLGTISSSGYIQNDSDMPSPVSIQLSGHLVNPMITNLETGEYLAFDISMQSGDVLVVHTRNGYKSVTYNGVDASGRIAAGSTYLFLPAGPSQLSFSAERYGLDAKVIVSYHNMALGV